MNGPWCGRSEIFIASEQSLREKMILSLSRLAAPS